MATCVENPEIAAVEEMSGNCPKVTEVSGRNFVRGKLVIAYYTFGAIPVFSNIMFVGFCLCLLSVCSRDGMFPGRPCGCPSIVHHSVHSPLTRILHDTFFALFSSTPGSKLIFFTNLLLHSSSTFPPTGLTPPTPAVFCFSWAWRF